MNWLITGGCGFIGTNLIRHLVAEGGHAIRVVDNLSTGTREDLGRVSEYVEVLTSDLPDVTFEQEAVQFIRGEILDRNLATKVTRGSHIIVHLAAQSGVASSVDDPIGDCNTNVIGTLNYLDAGRLNGISRFILASSGAVIGECVPPIHEEMVPHPVSPYGAGKLAAEVYCSAYYRTYGLNTTALRFGNVYGPGSGHKVSVVAKFIRQALNGEPLEIYGDGTQTRDFIYTDDLVRAIRLAATIPDASGQVFQIATSRETSIDELVENLLQVLGNAGINDIEVFNGAARQGDVMRNFSDTSKAEHLLGWHAEVNLSQGLTRTLNSFLLGAPNALSQA